MRSWADKNHIDSDGRSGDDGEILIYSSGSSDVRYSHRRFQIKGVIWRKKQQFWQRTRRRSIRISLNNHTRRFGFSAGESQHQGCVIKDPIIGETRSNNGIVFAGDLTQIAMSNVSLRRHLSSTYQSLLISLASDNLRASRGSFSIPNFSFRNLFSNKNGVLHDIIPSTFNIQPTPTAEYQQLHQMLRSEPIYWVFVMESSCVSTGAAILSSFEFYELYFPQSRWLKLCCEVFEFPRSCLWSNTVPTKAPSVYRFLDWSEDYSYQPVVVYSRAWVFWRIIVVACEWKSFEIILYHSSCQTNYWYIISLRGVNESGCEIELLQNTMESIS